MQICTLLRPCCVQEWGALNQYQKRVTLAVCWKIVTDVTKPNRQAREAETREACHCDKSKTKDSGTSKEEAYLDGFIAATWGG